MYSNYVGNNLLGIGLLTAEDNQIGSIENQELANTISNNVIGIGLLGFSYISPNDTDSAPTTGNYILGNDITNNYIGVGLLGAEENIIQGNVVEGGVEGSDLGIDLGEALNLLGLDQSIVVNKSLMGIGIGGIAELSLQFGEDALLKLPASSNQIIDNDITDIAGLGIALIGTEENTVEKNRIYGSGTAGIGIIGINNIGLRLTFDETDQEIWAQLPATDNEILENTVTDNSGIGIGLLGGSDNLIQGNNVSDNELVGIGGLGLHDIGNLLNLADEIPEDTVSPVVNDLLSLLPENIEIISCPDCPPAINEISSFLEELGVMPDENIIDEILAKFQEEDFTPKDPDNYDSKNYPGLASLFDILDALNVNYGGKEQIISQINCLQDCEYEDVCLEVEDELCSCQEMEEFFANNLTNLGIAPDLPLDSEYNITGIIPLASENHTIRGNKITGNRLAGVAFLNSDKNKVEYNTITGTRQWEDIPGTGILLSDADDTEITNNIIQDNEVGIYLLENLIEDFDGDLPEGNFAHYNSITGNNDYGVQNETSATFNAALNWWGDHSGPYHPTENPDGSGNQVSDNVIFSPWIGMYPDTDPNTVGVQLKSPLTLVVDDVGPSPDSGYLNTAVEAANSDELPGSDTIEVHNGDFETSSDQPVEDSVTIVSCMGCPMGASIDGELSITAEKVQIGGRDNYTAKGFNIDGDVRVEGDVDASEVHINWNNISGTVTNAANGTLDAEYNWWGDPDGPTADEAAGSMEGDVDYTPFLSMKVCALMEYMEEHNIDDPKDAVAGMVA
ncbi:right-handed parallel beta-helix repeat-containing protein, partial [Candidatus Bipolaricaulota bacterium]|nr:right-handed parallel beta-helix repeat-containing protein [Candidatus Bipolaricaulota bacterium]